MKNLSELKALEFAIYDAGVDGGETTSSAIEDLRDKEKELGVFNPEIPGPRWQDPSYEDSTLVCRLEARATPAGQLLQRMGWDYWDTESAARRVAEHAAGEIAELVACLTPLRVFVATVPDDLPEGTTVRANITRFRQIVATLEKLNL